MDIEKIGIAFLVISVLLLVNLPQADASLVGDNMHVKITNLGFGPTPIGVFCEEDVLVVDPGIEIPDCGGGQATIDIDGDSIWFESVLIRDGESIVGFLYEFTDMHWNNNPNGKITDVTVVAPLNIPIDPVIFDDHSITLQNPVFILDCGGLPRCIIEWHVDINTVHPVGGEFIPINTSALLLAGAQGIMAWMIPVVLSVLGIGLFVVSRKSENYCTAIQNSNSSYH